MTDTAIRKLTAIVSADVVGYSRLMGVDEQGTLETMRAHRSEFIDPAIEQYGGHIFKTTGDGLLIEFPSAVNAVQCSVDIQREMANCDTSIPEDQRIVYRVGINLGDVIHEDGDIFGDGVNVAARIEALAEPGGVYVSGSIHE
jgi:adenylate cyclase